MIKKIIIMLLLLLFLAVPVQSTVLFHQNFDDDTTGAYDADECDDDFEGTGFLTWRDGTYPRGLDEATIDASAEAYSGKSLKLRYPEGETGGGSSFTAHFELDCNYTELYYSFWVKWWSTFEEVDWQDGKIGGGLLGGIGPDEWQGGGGDDRPDGTNGWSGRTSFGAGAKEGEPYGYIYHPGQPTQYGQALEWDDGVGGQVYFTPGTWQHFEIYYKINTAAPGKDCDLNETDDGIIRAYVDGELVAERTDYCFRDNGETFMVNRLMITNFYGGSVPPDKDEYIWLDNITISTHRVGVEAEPAGQSVTLIGGTESFSTLDGGDKTITW